MKYVPSSGPICREAWPFALPLVALGFISLFLRYLWPLSFVFFLGAAFVVWFFRNPDRTGIPESGHVWSPADGKIVGAGIVPHPDFPDGQALRIAIFLSLFNVHVSWAPVSGTIRSAKHIMGKFLNAMSDKSAEENERKILHVDSDDGHELVVVLVAGLVARRIVCPIDTGDKLARGEKIALIRFGSRAEIFLPAASKLCVSPGQMVKGAQTTLAILPDTPGTAA